MRTLIVDDEAVARNGLQKMLTSVEELTVIGEASTGREAVEAIRSKRPDLVFLDVQMPEMNGFEVLQTVGVDELPIIVFVTAYDQYALRAFEVHAVDYLLKPFTDRRLQEAVAQAQRQFERDKTAALANHIEALLDRLDDDSPSAGDLSDEPLQRGPVKKRHRITFVDVDDVDWLEAADNYVELHLEDDTHLVRSTLSEMEERLPADQFVRIHRSAIVNIERIRELHPRGSGDCVIVLDDGTRLRSSRTYSERRKEALDFLG